MNALMQHNEPACRCNICAAKIIEQYNSFIVTHSRMMVYRYFGYSDFLDQEVDEMSQLVRIKFWRVLLKYPITNYPGYILKVIKSVLIDRIRQSKDLLPLPINEEGELIQGHLIVSTGDGMGNPEEEVVAVECLNQLVEAVSELPPRQQRAMISSLRERVDNGIRLIDAFSKYQILIEEIQWPEEKDERQRLKASLSPARRNVAEKIGVNLERYS
jgi:RNA polymerase sigma factor (sigma-70 family)